MTVFEDGAEYGADFRGARNYAIAADLNTLKQAKFSLPEAVALLHGLDIILEDQCRPQDWQS